MTELARAAAGTTATPNGDETIRVGFVGRERYEITIRGHQIAVDQPVDSGGSDEAATPTELFVASLAACVAYYAGRFLTRHGVQRAGLRVVATFGMAQDRPARVATITVAVHPPTAFPTRLVPALTAVVNHCTVHNSLISPPDVAIGIADVAAAAE